MKSLRERLADGGNVSVKADQGETVVPLEVTSVLPSKFEEGKEPKNFDRTIVLRGQNGDVNSAVIIRNSSATLLANAPGHDTLKIHVPADPTPDKQTDSGEDHHHDPSSDPLGSERILARQETDAGTGGQDIHWGPPGAHSMETSKYIHPSGEIDPKDPANAYFYHHGTQSNVEATLNNAGWEGDVCGSTKYLWVEDDRHGGTDDWQSQAADWEKDGECIDARHHVRLYPSATGDTHSDPSFQDYLGAPVHWDDTGHDNPDVQKGQDELLNDMSTQDGTIDNIRFVQVEFSSSECENCDSWQGWVDFYERYITSGSTDPCAANNDPTYTEEGSSLLQMEWRCQG